MNGEPRSERLATDHPALGPDAPADLIESGDVVRNPVGRIVGGGGRAAMPEKLDAHWAHEGRKAGEIRHPLGAARQEAVHEQHVRAGPVVDLVVGQDVGGHRD